MQVGVVRGGDCWQQRFAVQLLVQTPCLALAQVQLLKSQLQTGSTTAAQMVQAVIF